MAFEFREARREGVGLLVGLAGGTGSGKTYTGMRLAKGIAGDAKFAVIDTEAGRAKHYADQFRFDHGDLRPPFRPQAYLEAIIAADEAGYPAIVVDSMSHEHAGEGGLLDWHEEELARLTKNDPSKRDTYTMLSWVEPKMAHKRMVQRLLQVRAHLILCFRAEPKIEIAKENGRTVVREKQSLVGYKGWIPVAEKNLAYELTASFMFLADNPGVPLPIKLQEQHRALFPLDRPITEESGLLVAQWARGGAAAIGTSVDEWVARIKSANQQQLLALGNELRTAKQQLGELAMQQIRTAYDARLRQVGKPAQEGARR